jgi:transcription elongation factor Elf1
MAYQERDFFTEKQEMRPAQFACPRCGRRNEYQVRWVRRTKKDRLPANADERDRALYAKLRDYMIRVDDQLTCKTCQKKFEIPSHQSLVFVDDIPSGLPKEDYDE